MIAMSVVLLTTVLTVQGSASAFDCAKMNVVEVKRSATIDDYRKCLDNGFDPNEIVKKAGVQTPLLSMSYVSTPEHLAPDVVRLFLERGADPDGMYEQGADATPLAKAVASRWAGWRYDATWQPETTVAVITALLEHGADPNIRNRNVIPGGQEFGRPLSIVSGMRQYGIKGTIIVDRLGVTPLMLAVRQNEHHSIVRVLLEHGADPNMATHHENWTSLHIGAWHGNPRIMQALLDHGADPSIVTSQRKWTPLHVLAWSGGRKPRDAVATMRILIDTGVDLAARDVKGRTAWDIIVRRHRKELEAAIEAGQLSDETLAMLDRLRQARN